MFSVTIGEILREFQTHPIEKPSFLDPCDKTKFKHEIKYQKIISSYFETIAELKSDLEELANGATQESALRLLGRTTQAKTTHILLASTGLLSNLTRLALPYCDRAIEQAHALACQVLMGDVELETPSELDGERAESSYQQAKAIEDTINLEEIYILAKKRDGTAEHLFRKTIEKILQSHKLYCTAVRNGKQSAMTDVQRTASNHRLFQEFATKFSSGFQFSYNFFALFSPSSITPLTYHDWRMQPLFDFFIKGSEFNLNFQEDKLMGFVGKYMTLPPHSKAAHSILVMALAVISSEKFIRGTEDWDKSDLEEHREEQIKILNEIIDAVKSDCNLPEILKVPTHLKVNEKITNHVRIKHLFYAHNLGLVLDDRVEDLIDLWMAELRSQSLRYAVDDDDKNAQFAYLSRRDTKKLGLLLRPQEEISYSPSDIQTRYLNLTPMSVKHGLYHSLNTFADSLKITEKTMVDHLLVSATATVKFASSLRKLMEQQAPPILDGYFSQENPDHLTEKGARALLFATGYLKS